MGEKPISREDKTNSEITHIKRLMELFELGLGNTRRTIGYHGTSIESMQYLIRTGHLPGAVGENIAASPENSWLPQKGDLYFYPLKSKFPGYDPDISKYFPDETHVIDSVVGYASDIAESHCFLMKLGLGLDNLEYNIGARNLMCGMFRNEIREFKEKLISIGINNADIDQAVKEAKKRKGIILGLSTTLLRQYQPKDGDKHEGDLRFTFPKGLDYKYISGLEPLGEEEFNFFKNLWSKKRSTGKR